MEAVAFGRKEGRFRQIIFGRDLLQHIVGQPILEHADARGITAKRRPGEGVDLKVRNSHRQKELSQRLARVNCSSFATTARLPKALPIAQRIHYTTRSMKWILTLVCTLLVAGSALAAGPDDQYVTIYDLIQQGDTLSKSGNLPLAAQKYQEAQNQLKQLQSVSPNWNQNVVNFRLSYLAEKMHDLGKYIPAESVAATQTNKAPAQVKPTPESLEQQLAALQQQVQQLSADKSKLEAKLKEALSAQPAAVDPQELAKANQTIAALTKERDLLAVTLDQEKQKSQNPTGDNNEVATLRKQLTAAKDELAALKKNSQQENAALKAQIAKLKEANAGNSAPQLTTGESEKLNALSRERDELNKRVDQLTKEVADTEAKRDEDVLAAHKETEKLRGELKDVQAKRDQLQKSLDEWTQLSHVPDQSKEAVSQLNHKVQQLTDRIAVLESKPVPYSSEELALFKKASNQPAPAPKNVRSFKDLNNAARAIVADGQRLFQAKDYSGAEAKFRDALKQDPQNIYVIAMIANTQMVAEKYDACEATLNEAFAIDADDAGCLYLLGKLRLREDKLDAALDALSHSARINPTNAMTENALGNAFSRKGLRQPAENALRKALQIEPDFPEAHHNLALVYATDRPPSIELAKWHYKKATDGGFPKDADLEKLLK
jgi:tetratricopeptide (TPR) repeat protein